MKVIVCALIVLGLFTSTLVVLQAIKEQESIMGKLIWFGMWLMVSLLFLLALLGIINNNI